MLPIIVNVINICITSFFGYNFLVKYYKHRIPDEIIIGNVTQNFIPVIDNRNRCFHRY